MIKSGEILPVVWYKVQDEKEEKLNEDNRIEMIKLNKKLILKINNAEVEDSGTYLVSIGHVKAQAILTVNEIPIVFKKPLEDQRAKEGETATFECTVSRYDKPISWFINGKLLSKEDLNSGKYTISNNKNKLQLVINNLELEKDNNCEVTVQVGNKAKSSAKLRVIEDDIKFIERLADVGCKENESCQFVCKLNKLKYKTRSNDDLNIKWFIKGKEVNVSNPRYTIEQIDTTLKLKINSVNPEDAAEVKCQISNFVFTIAHLSVEEEPVTFVRKLTDLVCDKIPGKVSFECELNKPLINVKWFKNGKELTDSSKYEYVRDGTKHFLHIKQVDGKDEGDYTVVIQSKFEKKCTGMLSIKAAPKIFLNAKYQDTIIIKRGTPLSIEVEFTANPEPKYTWLFNDEKIKDSARTRTEMIKNKMITFTLNKTQRSDSGVYCLNLENDYGREKCEINVIVLDRPSPPQNLQVSDITGKSIKKLIVTALFLK
jgi:hypothetical protein